jgi:hypothetical protein
VGVYLVGYFQGLIRPWAVAEVLRGVGFPFDQAAVQAGQSRHYLPFEVGPVDPPPEALRRPQTLVEQHFDGALFVQPSVEELRPIEREEALGLAQRALEADGPPGLRLARTEELRRCWAFVFESQAVGGGACALVDKHTRRTFLCGPLIHVERDLASAVAASVQSR